MRRHLLLAATIAFALPITAWAAAFDVMIQRSDVTFRPERFFVGDLVRVYATVKNVGEKDVQGNVFFSENGTAIGTPPPFSVRARGAEEEVWVDWQPVTTGDRQIFIRIVTAPETRDEVPTNNEMIVPVFIDRDSNRNGIGDRDEPPPPLPAAPISGSSAGSTSGSATGSSPAVPATTAPKPSTPKRSSGAETALRPAVPPVVIAPAREETVTTSVSTTPATPPSESATNRVPYDTQLRDLLGGPAPRWRAVLPLIAGGIAAVAVLIALVLWIRRRPSHDADDNNNVGPRPPRSR